MGPEGAVNIILRKEIEQAKDPVAEKSRLVAEYREKFANPFKAAELGYIDEVIRPEQTRLKVIRALEMLKDKRQENLPRKHGNIPL
jgi:propionyl-CoA carboxylase beta chain